MILKVARSVQTIVRSAARLKIVTRVKVALFTTGMLKNVENVLGIVTGAMMRKHVLNASIRICWTLKGIASPVE